MVSILDDNLKAVTDALKAKGIRVRDNDSPIQPGEWREIDAPGMDLRNALVPLPYKEPSATLAQLLGSSVADGRRFIALADEQLSNVNNEAPVGTTVALLERGMKVMSAIHKRLHYAQKAEFRLLGVEASNEAVDHGDVFDDGSHDESVHPGVGDHGDRVHRFTPGLGGTVCEESLQGCLQANRGGLLEGEHPEIELGQTVFGIELGYDAIEHVDGFLGTGRQDGVQAGVGDHGHRHAAFGSVE